MIGGVIRWTLNHLPRTLLQRVASVGVPLVGLFYIGRGRQCPVCGCRRRKFLPYGYTVQRKNALCPACLALERHRLLWLWLTQQTELRQTLPVLLHIAPEVTLMRKFRRLYAKAGKAQNYLTADLESPLATLHFDVQQIPLSDDSVDVIICNHLLEHVESDAQALRELYRIMRHGGWGVLLSPVDLSLAQTIEDPLATSAEQRTALYGQYDHRRLYGRDYTERLRGAGFRVQDVDYAALLSERERELYALTDEHIYVVYKD